MSAAGESTQRKENRAWSGPWTSLTFWIVALVLLRGWLALAGAEVYFYGEELAKGTCAKMILDRPPVPYWTITYGYHEGGGFVVSHLKALGFLAFGESLLVHKLVALLTAALVLWSGWALAKEVFSRRTATLFALLYVLAPESFLRFSLLSLGTHFEAVFFACHMLRLTLRLARNQGGSAEEWMWLGLTAGFGTYFSLQTLPVTAVAFVGLWIALRGRLWCKGLAASSVAWIAGIMPLLAMLWLAGESVVRVRGAAYGSGAQQGFFQPLLDLFGPLQAGGAGGWSDWVLFVLHATLCVAAPFVLRDKRFALGLLYGYLALYFTLYVLSGLAVSMGGIWFVWIRLCAPWVITSIVVAAVLDQLWTRRKAWAAGALAVYAACGAQDLVQLSATGDPARITETAQVLATTRGVDYVEYLDRFETHFEVDDQTKVQWSMYMRDTTRELPAGVAHAIFEKYELPTEQLLSKVRQAFGPRYKEALLGLGRALHPGEAYDMPFAFAALAPAPDEDKPLLAEAIGRSGIGPRFRADRLDQLVNASGVPEQWREAYWRGCGWRVRITFRVLPARGRAWCEAQPEPMRSALLAGFEQADRDLQLP